MPNYRIIVQETKSYFVEADNEELAMDAAEDSNVHSRTLDFYEVEEYDTFNHNSPSYSDIVRD